MGTRSITATQVLPGGPTVGFDLAGSAQLSRYGMASMGMGGWQIVDRPRQQASTEWVDYSPYELDMSLIIDGWGDGTNPQSIEQACSVVENWEQPAPGTNPPEPSKLRLAGAVLPAVVPTLLWVVYIVTWKDALRDAVTGERLYQELSVTLFEYAPPRSTITTASPAAVARSVGTNPYASGQYATATTQFGTQAAQSVNAATSGGLAPVTGPSNTLVWSLPAVTPYASTPVTASTAIYTVRAGDTLPRIAGRELGDQSLWVQIAQLNGIRDPRNVRVGQRLRMPAVKGHAVPVNRPPTTPSRPVPQIPAPFGGLYGGPTVGNVSVARRVG